MSKLKVGVYNFTCCEGCTIVLIEALHNDFDEWLNRIDFVDFRTLKPFKGISKTDVAFVEGAISTKEEVEKLKEIRKNTKKLIAFGSGAAMGYPSDQRNKFGAKKLKEIADDLKKFKQIAKVSPLSKFVKVDGVINGCPINEADIIKKIGELMK
jgi:sulfhydrogenase subunit delta